jgi:hypothetical protein
MTRTNAKNENFSRSSHSSPFGKSEDSAAFYAVSFDAEGGCELLPNDKSRVLNTQPVKEEKTTK